MTPAHFHELLITLSTRFGFRVTSTYRSLYANRNLTTADGKPDPGHPESRHMVWLAADVVLDDPGDTAAFTKEAKRQGLVVIEEGDHLHVQ
jgi:uncharacterized protein YcbK (DUF882 family)